MITLGIETSCDETAVALVENGKVLASEVSSSVHLHSEYGGVVPEIASRYHVEYILPVLEKVFKVSGKDKKDVNLVAVTGEPGLPGSLLVGLAFARSFSFASGIPLIVINHLEAHIVSAFLNEKPFDISDKFPFLGMVISGGHTSIYYCRGIKDFELIGRTKDDAVGEAFDKVAKILGLGYPGGPVVEKKAKEYSGEEVISFPRALLRESEGIDFSFSGIKTAVLYHWQSSEKTGTEKNRICYSYQEAVIDIIDRKVKEAIDKTGARTFAVGGGVVNNELLRERLIRRCGEEGVRLYLPDKKYCADNAAMIAAWGEIRYTVDGRR